MEDFDIEGAVNEISLGMGLTAEQEELRPQEEVKPETSATTDSQTNPAPTTTPTTTSPTGTQPPAQADQAAPTVPTTPPAPDASAPRTWKPDAAAEWANLPPRVREEILKREDDMFRGLESYKGDATVGKAVQNIFQPFREVAQADGLDPGVVMHEALTMHTTLSRGSQEQKLAALHSLASRYGVSLQPANPDDEPPFVDPQVARLQAEVASVKSQQMALAREREQAAMREQTAAREKLQSEIETFAKDPANPDFDLLSSEMAKLLQSGAAKDLRDAYDQAIWLNPVTRQKAIDSAAAAKAEAEKKAQAEAAAKAKASASANVRTQAKNASGTAASGSMDDTLNEAYARLVSQGN